MTKASAKAPAFKLIEGTDNIDKAITSIKTRGKKMDKDIHIAAVSAMAHHDKHGDVSRINKLVAAMPKGSRVNALRDFINTFGKVSYDEDNKVFMHNKEGEFDLQGAMGISWTEFKPEKAYIPFDAMASLKVLVKKVKATDAAKGDKCTKEQAAAILTLAASMGVEA